MSTSPILFGRVVVKVGSSVLTDSSGRADVACLTRLADEMATAIRAHHEIILVSSGAVACGMSKLGLRLRPKDIAQLQACAAIGQGELMRLYSHAFGARDLVVAQVLLTQADLADPIRYRNASKTFKTLLQHHVVPIVNENDTVAVDEITFGDNDRLAALVACEVSAQLLILLSDVDGLMEHGQLIERIDQLNHAHRALALCSSRETSVGGMASKLAAARIVRHAGIPMVIANGRREGVLQELLAGKPLGTLMTPPQTRLAFRKWWLAFAMRKPSGAVVIDAGAVEALIQRRKSLLASGVRDVQGRFHAGDAIRILDADHAEIARGIANFSSSELSQIQGLRSDQLTEALGRKPAKTEVVHRDQLVLTHELEG